MPKNDLDAFLREAVSLGASDLHLSPGLPPTVRIDGQLAPLDRPVVTADRAEALISSILTGEQRARLARDLELDLAYSLPEGGRFRANAYFGRGAPGAAFRSIPATVPELGELGLPPVVAGLTEVPRGIVLVTGPTGSGKSTTLAAMIDRINRTRSVHVVTVEDPTEYLHAHKKSVITQREVERDTRSFSRALRQALRQDPDEFLHRDRNCIINQREVGQDTASFKRALRRVLRQDPDVILVGEMRDLETIALAVTAAETGQLVLATLHTQSAPQTVDRIIDVFPSHQQRQVRTQLANTLQAVVSQTLVRRRGGGRVAACEVLAATPGIRNMIRDAKTHQIPSAMQTGAEAGMRTMNAALAQLVRDGLVAPEDAEAHSGDTEELRRLAGPARNSPRDGLRASSGR